MKKDTRDRLLLPILFPVGGLSLIAVLVLGFSRILLSLSKDAATATAVVVAVGVLATAVRIATLPKIRVSSLASMVLIVASVGMVAGGIAVATVGAGKHEGGGGGGGAPGGPAPVTVALTAPKGAAASGYAQTKLTFPADTPILLAFDNQDVGVPHNVVITDNSNPTQGTQLFRGDVITGSATTNYQVDPLPAGTYYFHCEIHPTTMTGTITVTAGGGGEATGSPTPGATGSPAAGGGGGGPVSITAEGIQFDTNLLMLPASGTVTIHFTNNDAGIPHNIGIYSADPASDPSATELFRGDPVTGPGSADYTFAALPAGTYWFQCDIHPTMHGTVTVG